MVRAVGGRAVTLLMDGYASLAVNGEGCRPGLMKQFLTASCLAGMAVNNGGAGPLRAPTRRAASGQNRTPWSDNSDQGAE